ncbi:DUF418 domain-containing protein [Alkalihalobacillus pseudalcaliphilus]|uniref:DUF418 domain-containing protein n=1 Tax=Alkalihalobacillus pseudalcaliphilus TaxID=79884 RepID=UPI00064D80FB|nr:DUF418 domain-containing protein [Alkalihalobacillus pseudalcaliphilus]KMK75643.1 hypothetical protein AB990_10185 [Alkalihalobacillus pseudalcaliphilus]
MKPTLAPLNQGRLQPLDMMRGLAILGILLVNIMNFQYGLLLLPDVHQYYPLGTIDQLTESILYLFIRTSFYTLFAFLFGYGMVILQDRSTLKEASFTGIFWRRAFFLFILGILHRTYIWEGDILVTYAIASFILFFFLFFKAKGLLISAIIFLGVMLLFIPPPGSGDVSELQQQEDTMYQYSLAEKEVLENGTYLEVLEFRMTSDITGLGIFGDILMEISTVIAVMGMFLLGAYFARKKWLDDIEGNLSLFKKIWWVTLFVGFGTKLPYAISPTYFSEGLMLAIGGPFTAIFYVTSVILLSRTEKGAKLLHPLTYVGRLSLTNYLLQSIVFTTLFYGYGIGLFGQLGFFVGTCIAIVFFVLQVLVSKWWLSRFVIGPVEWFFRAVTYMIMPKFKK